MDIRLVQGGSASELLVQIKSNSSASFGGVLSALTATIRYDAASGASLGSGTSFCPAWSAFTPSPVVVNDGTAYRTYNGFGLNRLGDPVNDGGCGMSIPAGTWFTVTTIPVIGGTCTTFTLGNDAFTNADNRDYFISMNGVAVVGSVLGGPVLGGNCTPDCLGVPGGSALPGTACDDGDPNTTNDTWDADCACIGTVSCTAPAIGTVGGNSPVCSNGTLNLSVTATGTAPFSYAWSGTGTFLPGPGSQSVAVSGAATGTYQVTVTNAC
ncbi:MAG: hypothetical protein J5I62_10125, partial [Flavobacteriales bacterium]|nr:hypothetical protein [Flavobacteriales bacterium]